MTLNRGMAFRAIWYIPRVISIVSRASNAGMHNAGQELLERSLAVVPRLTEALANSAELSVKDGEAVVSYTSPYAVAQHEDPTLKHASGKQAKFLEGPLDQLDLDGHIGMSLRKVMPPVHV